LPRRGATTTHIEEGRAELATVEMWEDEEEREKETCGAVRTWERIRSREKKKTKKWTFYPFQQLEKVFYQAFFSNQ
jgi:hypothetical protein